MKQLEEKTNLCKICCKPINEISFQTLLRNDVCVCSKCFKDFSPVFGEFVFEGIKGEYIYHYDENIQKNLFQFKGCFDYELKNTFFDRFYQYLKRKYKGYVIIPAPSTNESDKTRGFNHVIEIFKPLGLEILNCVRKVDSHKQANSSAKERKNISKFLEIDNVDLTNRKILICDDVFTTGSTMKTMIQLVREKNPKIVKFLVMSKTKFNTNEARFC